MRQVVIVLLTLLVSPAALAECPSTAPIGDSGLWSTVSNRDRRAVEALLGTPPDEVICGRISRVWRRQTGFRATPGFFVLTPNDAVFVSDGKVKEVVFRAAFADVHERPRTDFGPGHDYTIDLDVTTGAGQFRVALACDAIAQRFVDELERRAPGARRASQLPQHPCD